MRQEPIAIGAIPSAQFIADNLERLAQLVRLTHATTPEEHAERIEILDDDDQSQMVRQRL